MLHEEAIWLHQQLDKFSVEEISPLLNVGSSTEYFRKERQPFIDQYIFTPLRKKAIRVVHTDLDLGTGVDISGDLTDEFFLNRLKGMKIQALLCNNLLEHVPNRHQICDALQAAVVPEGYLFVTVPHRFPYHPHPIDTMFRPNINELANHFLSCKLISSTIIESNRTQFKDAPKTLRYFLGMIRLVLNPFSDSRRWRNFINYLPFWFSRYKVTCLVLKKVK